MLFYTGVTRSANSILAEQTANIKATAISSTSCATSRAWPPTGCAAGMQTQLEKRCARAGRPSGSCGGISNPQVDMAIERVLEAGELGAKLTGAGGGGFLVVICPVERQRAAREPGGHE